MAQAPPLFQTYVPEGFCREFVELRGHSLQLPLFMSLVLGIKPLMDDWVPLEVLDPYLSMCRGLGLHARVEATNLMLDSRRVPELVVGGDRLTSTHALGVPAGSEEPRGRAHVFLSRDRSLLQHGMWYPLIVRDRVIWPPYADMLKYGRLLGYPDCCVRFFRQRNDWSRYSFLYEIYRNTGQASPRRLCNPLTKDRTYSYIYHMPCRFDCPATLALAGRLREEILAREPALVRAIDRHLALPALVFYERKQYVFEGTLRGRRLDYSAVHYPDGASEGRAYLERLRAGDALELEGEGVRISRAGREVDRILPHRGFAPEHPFLIQFMD